MSRRESREAAVKIIFQNMFTDRRLSSSPENETPTSDEEKESETMIKTYIENTSDEIPTEQDRRYIANIIDGVINSVSEIDSYIIKYSKDWTIDRMSRIDLAIMRVAIFEILYRDDIPVSVSINEAVELAKKYSHKEAGSFINGILGSVYSESDS